MDYGSVMIGAWKDWRDRHRHPVSMALHVIAIPMLVLAGMLVAVQFLDGAWSLWWRPAALVVISYVLQWIGHVVEGNDMGELILIKKLLGKPYVAIGPRKSNAQPSFETARAEVRGTPHAPTESMR
jgi:hypothetical protein